MLIRQYIRRGIQAGIFVLILLGLDLPWLRLLTLSTPDWLCPFFQLQSLSSLVFRGSGSWIWLMAASLGGLVMVSWIFGRIFCGWICPMGALLDGFGALRDPKAKHPLPEWIGDRTIKYGLLLGFLISGIILARPVFCDICPAGGFYRGVGVIWIYPTIFIFVPLLILLLAILAAIFCETRAWCKYWCPLGAFISLFNPISAFKIRLPTQKCIECLKCELVCVMDLRPLQNVIWKHAEYVTSPECIRCFACIDSCPMIPRTPLKLAQIS